MMYNACAVQTNLYVKVVQGRQTLMFSNVHLSSKISNIIGASLSETHMMRSTGILSVCHTCCLFVRAFTFRIYSCSNSTITHAQNLRAKYFSHVVCTCIYLLVCVRVGVRVEVHGLHLRTRINQSHHRSL